MMSEKSRFVWSGQGRSPRRGNSQAEEDERNRHEKSEEKGIPGGRGTSCARALGEKGVGMWWSWKEASVMRMEQGWS